MISSPLRPGHVDATGSLKDQRPGNLAVTRIVLAADRSELFVRNDRHVAVAIDVVNLEQRRPLSTLARSNLNGAAVVVAGEDALPRLAPLPRGARAPALRVVRTTRAHAGRGRATPLQMEIVTAIELPLLEQGVEIVVRRAGCRAERPGASYDPCRACAPAQPITPSPEALLTNSVRPPRGKPRGPSGRRLSPHNRP